MSSDERRVRPRRVGRELKRIPPQERVNPQVFRAFLHEWVSSEFDRDTRAAAEAIEANRPNPGEKGFYRAHFGSETLYDLINERTQIKYVHLDAIARYHGIPVSMLLLYTRIRSELEEPSPLALEEASKILSAMAAFVSGLQAMVHEYRKDPGDKLPKREHPFDYHAFKILAAAFRSAATDDQIPLF